MVSPAHLSVWADRMLDSLSETGISNASVVTWMQNTLYSLNLAIGSQITVNSSGYLTPDLNQYESGIYEQMYFCYYYNKKANEMLGAASWDWTEIQGESQGSIRKVSKNEIAKTRRTQATDCKIQLKELIDWYNSVDLMMAGQILLGDRGDIAQGDQMSYCQPPNYLYTSNSTIWPT